MALITTGNLGAPSVVAIPFEENKTNDSTKNKGSGAKVKVVDLTHPNEPNGFLHTKPEDDRSLRDKFYMKYGKEFWKDHFENCRKFTLEAVNERKGKLLIIAPDHMERAIFSSLIKPYPDVCLVGISQLALWQCIKELPSDQRKKHNFTLVRADLTESIAKTHQIFVSSSKRDLEKNLMREVKVYETSEFDDELTKTIRAFGRPNMIVSCLYVSDIPLNAIQNLQNKFASKGLGLDQWATAAERVYQCKHFIDLFKWVDPNGLVCYIDSTHNEATGQQLVHKDALLLKNKLFETQKATSHDWKIDPFSSAVTKVECSLLMPRKSLVEGEDGKNESVLEGHNDTAVAGAGVGPGPDEGAGAGAADSVG